MLTHAFYIVFFFITLYLNDLTLYCSSLQIPQHRIPSAQTNPSVPKAVGVSIHFDKIVTALMHDEEAVSMNSGFSIMNILED